MGAETTIGVMGARTWATYVGTDGNPVLDSAGDLTRDYSVLSRCRVRLMARRGEYWYDPTFGSRLHTIRTLKDAQAKVLGYAREALQPLVDEGAVLAVELGQVELDHASGQLLAELLITTGKDETLELNALPLGRTL